MHDETLDFLGVPGEVFVESDASKDPDADDHHDDPEVEEVQDGVRPIKVVNDPNWDQGC